MRTFKGAGFRTRTRNAATRRGKPKEGQSAFRQAAGYSKPSPTAVINNGNVREVKDTLNNLRTQTFTYDHLNRLDYASTPDWSQDYT